MNIVTRKQPTGYTLTYNSIPHWDQFFGEGGKGWSNLRWMEKAKNLTKECYSEPDIVLDCGANVGMTMLHYQEWCRDVFSYEPIPSLYKLLKKNVEQNNLSNVHAFNYAIGNKVEDVQMKDTPNDAACYITNSKRGKNVTVKSITIDSIDIPEDRHVSFIKLDVEGYEGFAIMGGRNVIKKHKPVLQLELREGLVSRWGHTCKSIIDDINSMGYVTMLCNGKIVDTTTQTYKDWRGDIFCKPV
jgi:FkbM family methyltransferase